MSIIHLLGPGKAAGGRLAGFLLATLLLFSGCASAPYQEMSDARQAVESAETSIAGAPSTNDSLRRARQLLERAEAHLADREYDRARHYAGRAKALAIEARDATGASDD